MWCVETVHEDVHVYPHNDLREHALERGCWCRPEIDEHDLVIHNALDGREAYERGERLPS